MVHGLVWGRVVGQAGAGVLGGGLLVVVCVGGWAAVCVLAWRRVWDKQVRNLQEACTGWLVLSTTTNLPSILGPSPCTPSPIITRHATPAHSPQDGTPPNWAPTAQLYTAAIAASPALGWPHNQLAVLCFSRGDELGMAYRYCRALACSVPFPMAHDNVIVMVESARQRAAEVRVVAAGV